MKDELQNHFLNMYAMALTDMQIATVELEMLYKIGWEKGIEKVEIDQLILNPDKVKLLMPQTLTDKVGYLYDLAKIIIADGNVDDNEKRTLEIFCNKFGFEEANIPTIVEFLITSAKDGVQFSTLLEIINQTLN